MDRSGGMTVPQDRPLVVMATDSAVPSGVGTHMLTLARAVGATYRVTLAFPPTDACLPFLNRAAMDGFATRADLQRRGFRAFAAGNRRQRCCMSMRASVGRDIDLRARLMRLACRSSALSTCHMW